MTDTPKPASLTPQIGMPARNGPLHQQRRITTIAGHYYGEFCLPIIEREDVSGPMAPAATKTPEQK